MRFGRQSDGNAIDNPSEKFANAHVWSRRAEGYFKGCTFSFYKGRGVTLLGRENREILHSFALINEFHRLAPAALCVKCTGSNPFFPGVSIGGIFRGMRVGGILRGMRVGGILRLIFRPEGNGQLISRPADPVHFLAYEIWAPK